MLGDLLGDQRLRARICNRPDCGDGLGDAEREVVTGHRAAGAALGFLGLDRGDLSCSRCRPQLRVECVHALLDPLGDTGGLLLRTTQSLPGDGVVSHADEEL